MEEEKYFLTRGKAILAGLIFVAVIVVFIVIKTGGAASTQKYKDFENELKSAAESYYEINNMDIEDGEIKRISMNEVLKVYSTDNELKDRCVGYVTFSSEKDITSDDYSIIFRPYIKCGKKYTSSNYSEY